MKRYDVIIIGGEYHALLSAVYLSKRFKNVALLTMGKSKSSLLSKESVTGIDGSSFTFERPFQAISGLKGEGLFSSYLQQLDIFQQIYTKDHNSTTLVKLSGHSLPRPNTLDAYEIHLIRHYPKSHNGIKRFINESKELYYSYKQQRSAQLSNQPYTLNLLRAKWGNISIKDVLKRYFEHEDIFYEFAQFDFVAGIPLDQINACEYFVGFFTSVIDERYFVDFSQTSFKKEIAKRIETVDIITAPIETVVIEENVILGIKTKNIVLEADVYLINEHPETFIATYVEENKGFLLEMIPNHFKFKAIKYYRYEAFIGISGDLSQFGLLEQEYIFESGQQNGVNIVRLLNYSAIDQESAPKGMSSIIVTYIATKKQDNEEILEALSKWLPTLKDSVKVFKIITEYPIFPWIKSAKKSLKTLSSDDHHQTLKLLKNAYFTGNYYQSASGFTGKMMNTVEICHEVKQSLLIKTHEKGLTSEQLLAMFIHSLSRLPVLKQEKRIALTLGRIEYLLYLRNNEVSLVETFWENPNLELEISHSDLADLLVLSNEKVPRDVFKYKGDIQLYDEILDAFVSTEKQKNRHYESLDYRFGNWFLHVSLILVILPFILGFFVNSLIVSGCILALFILKIPLQRLLLKRFVIHDYLYIGLLAIWMILLWLIPKQMNLAYLMLGLSLITFTTVFINRNFVDDYIFRDFHPQYTNTSLYRTISSGLSIVWGIAFFMVFISTLLLVDTYKLLGLFLILFMFYLQNNYSLMYVKSLVKTRR